MARPKTAAKRKRINLALQGGGSHGAFAWGVLDRLLESDLFEIEGVVGTSAGAMNAAVLAHGLAIGGNEGARAELRRFWHGISESTRHSPLKPSPLDRIMQPGSMQYSPVYMMFDLMTRLLSPYQLNPGNVNPLRDLLQSIVQCEDLRNCVSVKLFICATNVLSGKIRVFQNQDVSIDAVMASACLPFLFQAVEVDGEHYWDGGYMGNPPIYPLIYDCESRDVLIVQINPIRIEEVPTSAHAIMDRINTLSFNSSLMREMRAIHFVTKMIDGGYDDNGRLKRMLIHSIDAEEELRKFGASSKLNAEWDFLQSLFELGRSRADLFITAHYDKVGRESSTDLIEKFL
ncbi:patatin-like phospholipase family protein [Ferrovibrio sp.]|uniref:patatin-like phospholipase family protein n=1 Tax=Ferrovibrio sp. TaxID=1917215 RepID=UPI001B3F3EF3|nr:patatin-like phospholipase family protein [Ferrovibrio sp.]MBP7066112.1 patatin-like phospholipase family protein [Ferrovibrio sp.]